MTATGTGIAVTHLGADRFRISVRGHEVEVDQPVAAGGEDTAPTPTELLVASLASCVAFYARRHLARHGLPTRGLEIRAGYELGTRPARVTELSVELTPPGGLPPERRDALLAVASRCTVHNTLADPPTVTVSLADGSAGIT